MRSLDPLLVKSDAANRSLSATELMVGPDHFRYADTAVMVARMPGAAIVRNGSQTGILQLCGLSGARVAVRVDGMTITPACPNHMDPPLHYAHPAGGDLIELMAGISPVSAGGDHNYSLRPVMPGDMAMKAPLIKPRLRLERRSHRSTR